VDCIHPKKDTQYDDGRPEFEQVDQLFIDPIEEIAGQLDVSSRRERTLGIVLPPCRIVQAQTNCWMAAAGGSVLPSKRHSV
jgi:hypothetical protein